MRKTLLATLPVAAFVAGMAVVPSVFAAGGTYTDWTQLKECLQNTGGEAVTCTVGADNISATDAIVIGDNVTLDLGGKILSLTGDTYFYLDPGHSFTIKNGTVSRTGDSQNRSTVVIIGNTQDDPTEFTLESSANITGNSGVAIQNNGSTKKDYSNVVIDGNITNNQANQKDGGPVSSQALTVSGNIQENGPTVTIRGQLTGVNAGIYQAGTSNITLEGASVTGESGIVTKAGSLTLKNATVTATGEPSEGTSTPGGFLPTGAGIQVEATSNYAGNINIDIQNGTTITSEKGDAMQAYGSAADKIDAVTITGDDVTLDAPNGSVLAVADEETINFPELTVNGEKVSIAELATLTEFTTAPAPAPETPADTTPNPDTADPISLYITIAAVALIGLSATAVLAKKARR